jgi:large repetitive protein
MQSIQSFLRYTLLPMPSSLAATVFTIFFASSALMAQTPGGVSSGLTLWYDPISGTNTTTDGSTVNSWADKNATGTISPTVTGASNLPLYKTGNTGSNFNPYLDFSASGATLGASTTGASGISSHTTFGVVTPKTASTGFRHFMRFHLGDTHKFGLGSNSTAPDNVGIYHVSAPFIASPGSVSAKSNTNVGTTIVLDQPTLMGARVNASSAVTTPAYRSVTLSKDGNNALVPNAFAAVTDMTLYNASFNLGSGGIYGMQSYIHEIVMYERALTDNETQRVNTYLAIKHGNTLDHDYLLSTSAVIWSKGTNAAYHNNVFGIGKEAAQGLDQKQSKSANTGFQPIISTTSFNATNAINTTSLTNATFEMAGSDNGAVSFATAFVFGNVNNRMTRIWKVQETGTVGTVRVLVPQGDMPGINPSLLHSASTAFNASSMIAMSPITVGGVAYYYADVNFENNDFFSFATFMTAPGGVTANLQLWFDPAKGVATSGTALSTWANQGGLGATANLLNGTASRPTLSPAIAAQNYNPYVTVGAAQRMWTNPVMPGSIAQTSFLTATLTATQVTAASMIYRNDVTTSVTHEHGLGNGGTLSGVQLHYWTGATTINRSNTSATITGTKPFLYGGRISSTGKSVSINGNNADYAEAVTNNLAVQNRFLFGDDTYGNTGNVNEIITYDRDLTDIERDKVNTYLGIKYGLTLSNNYISAGGTTIWNRGAGGFNNRITGIGREGIQGLHQKQSKSVDAGAMITMGIDNTIAATNAANTGAFDNDAFLVWGDNDGTGTVVVTPGTACTPASVDKVTNRAFKVVETGVVESVKVSADLSSFGFSANYPVFMQVASDAAFTAMIANVPMALNGSNYETNYNFDSTKYVRFTGNTSPPANVCTSGNKVLNWQWLTSGQTVSGSTHNYWFWGERARTYTQAGQEFQVTVSDPDNVMYAKNWYPVSLANYLYMPRYDAKPNSKITTKIKIVNAADHTTPQPAQAIDFKIIDLDGWVWGKDNVNVYGKLGATTVNAKISKSAYSPIALSPPNQARGAVLPWNWSAYGSVYVSFDSPVDEVYVEYTKNNVFNPVFNDLAIGKVNIKCSIPMPQVSTPDNVYVFKELMDNTVHTNDDFTYKFTLQNNNCGNKTISFSDVLPAASLSWRDSTLATSMTFASANAYGNGQTLSLTGLVVPPGTSYLYIDAKGTAAGTFNNQASFVVNGNTYSSDDPDQTGAANPTPVTITALPTPGIAITKAVDKSQILQNGVVKYTYVLTNSEASAIPVSFFDALDKKARYVGGSLTTIAGSPQIQAYADSAAIVIRDVTIPANGSITFSINANVKLTAVSDTVFNVATITPDPSVTTFRQVTRSSNTVNTILRTPLAVTAPTAASVAASAAISGNAATELAPTGGIGAYTYTDATATCTAPSGATQLPASSNLMVTSGTGAYTYTAPATAGTYYYCIKVCDSDTPTANCVTSTYTINVTAAATGICSTTADNDAIFVHQANGTKGIVRISSVSTAPTTTGAIEIPSGALNTAGITISNHLNGGSGYQFYAVNGFPNPSYHHYNGSGWTATGHLGVNGVNPGGGTNYIFNYTGSSVTRYDGTGNATTVLAASPFTGDSYYDVAVDNADNFYLLSGNDALVKKYDANGTLLATFTTVGAPVGINPGFAFISGNLYALDGSRNLHKGVLSGSVFTFTQIYTLPGTAIYNDLAVCPTASAPVVITTPLTASNPPAQTPTAGSGTQNGNAVTELTPTGGTPAYTYTNDTGNPSCTAPSGATAITGLTVNLNTGAYSYPTPATPGAYYFCIKICDNGAPQQCVTKTYTVNVQPTMLAVPLPAPLTPIAGSGPQNGTPSTPTGGTAPYHYSNGSGLGTCTAPSGATLITPVTVNPTTGAFQYTTPSTAGSYYFCIQTCDSSSPTAQCVNTTYPVNVSPAACAAAAQTLSK